MKVITEGFKEMPHGLQGIDVEVGSHLFPKQAFAAPFGPRRLEQRTTQLLDLIHQKRQHHQRRKYHGEVISGVGLTLVIAVAEIVLEMVALIFQRIERLIFDTPAH